jgi:hypothetical protein
MELIIMIVIAFPIGFFIKNRTVAYLTYIAAHGFVFVFQTVDATGDAETGARVVCHRAFGHARVVFSGGADPRGKHHRDPGDPAGERVRSQRFGAAGRSRLRG